MKKVNEDYQQQKITGGKQKVILNEKETAETDELDPKFEEDKPNTQSVSKIKPEPGNDPKTELV